MHVRSRERSYIVTVRLRSGSKRKEEKRAEAEKRDERERRDFGECNATGTGSRGDLIARGRGRAHRDRFLRIT